MTTSQLTIVMGILLVIGIFNLRHQEKKAKKKEAFMAEQRKKFSASKMVSPLSLLIGRRHHFYNFL